MEPEKKNREISDPWNSNNWSNVPESRASQRLRGMGKDSKNYLKN